MLSFRIPLGLAVAAFAGAATVSTPAQAANFPMAVQAPRSDAPTPPVGMKLSCPKGPADNTQSETCPVIRIDDRSFWIFSFKDNRNAIAIVEYDSEGNAVKQMVKTGLRYPYRVTTKTKKRQLTIWGQADKQTTLGIGALNAPQFPVVMKIPVSEAPNAPAGTKVSCLTSPTELVAAAKCPVLLWHGVAYWAFSYTDNHSAMAVLGIDSRGQQIGFWNRNGARYLNAITVNPTDRSVKFRGQSSQTVKMTFNALRSS